MRYIYCLGSGKSPWKIISALDWFYPNKILNFLRGFHVLCSCSDALEIERTGWKDHLWIWTDQCTMVLQFIVFGHKMMELQIFCYCYSSFVLQIYYQFCRRNIWNLVVRVFISCKKIIFNSSVKWLQMTSVYLTYIIFAIYKLATFIEIVYAESPFLLMS